MSRYSKSDYINREMAADSIVIECDGVTLEQARQAIKDCPSADVVKVVRCKDCKQQEKFLFDDSKLVCWAHDTDIVVSPTDFCSYGENAEEQEEREIINARRGEE